MRGASRRGSAIRRSQDTAGKSARSSLASVAAAIARPRKRTASSLESVAAAIASNDEVAASDPSAPLDVALPARAIAMELILGRGHYDRVIPAVLAAKVSVWIATATTKELMVEDPDAPKRRRDRYVSILAKLDELAARGVELRVLHAELPSRPFRAELAHHPRLVEGGLALRRCPRVHLKAVIVDGSVLYLGSANWTGAGLGAKGSGRRNFELGFVTDDAPLLDQVQSFYERIWSGGECGSCKLREVCPGPLDELQVPGKRRKARGV